MNVDDYLDSIGITPGPWKAHVASVSDTRKYMGVTGDGMNSLLAKYLHDPDARLIAQSREMLKWMVRDLHIQDVMDLKSDKSGIDLIRDKYGDEVASHLESMYGEQKRIIEAATGKTWAEIKEALDD